jgi:glucosamine kinase
MSFLIGIDGGGTGCRAVVCDPAGRRLGYGKAGPANLMTNFDGARKSIVEACNLALAEAGLPSSALADSKVFLGLAGAKNGDTASRMQAKLPFRRCLIETDAVIALEGALGPEDGAVAIIGTGSIFIYRVDGIIRVAGGWGFLVGDLGSGGRLGRALLQETLLTYDSIHPGSELTARVLSRFANNPQTIVEYAQTARPGEFGELAPLVFEFAAKGDPVGQRIIRKAVADIEDTLNVILAHNRLGLCMLGGLGQKFAPLLDSRIRSRMRPPRGDALDGAIALARKHFSPRGDHGV